MRKIMCLIAFATSSTCFASSEVTNSRSSELRKSATSEVRKCYDDRVDLYKDDVVILGEKIIVMDDEKYYISSNLHCDEEGLYVYKDELFPLLDTAQPDDYGSFEYHDYYNRD